jgi:hypothetical protein
MSPYTIKIARVADWPTSTNQKEVQSFVGFINFYCQSIPRFSHHAHALLDLTMKDVRFIWGLPQEDFFIKPNKLVTSAPILVLPDDDLPSQLEADSSGITTGAVLSQQSHEDNAWHPITFLSKALHSLDTPYRFGLTTRISNISESPRNSINVRQGGCFTCQDLTSRFTISQVEVWVNQTHSLGELITVQVEGTMTTSLSSPLSYFESMHSRVQDLKARSKIYYKKLNAVSVMIHKRN